MKHKLTHHHSQIFRFNSHFFLVLITNSLQLSVHFNRISKRSLLLFFRFKHRNALKTCCLLLFTPIETVNFAMIPLLYNATQYTHLHTHTHVCMLQSAIHLIKETSFYYYILYVQGQFISCRVVPWIVIIIILIVVVVDVVILWRVPFILCLCR